VIVGRFLNRKRLSGNARVYNLWSIERRLQLIVSQPVIDEYLATLEQVTDEPHLISLFRDRLHHSPTVTRVNLGVRFSVSRDPDDDILLATAHTGVPVIWLPTTATYLRFPQIDVAVLDLTSLSPLNCSAC
jgi:predicted nucleic acid-binding protein